jgi:hypothetical protein
MDDPFETANRRMKLADDMQNSHFGFSLHGLGVTKRSRCVPAAPC